MTDTWELALQRMRFAFQPIARASDGRAYGYEALLRGWNEAGFPGIASVFDCAYLDGLLLEVDGLLRAKAFADFAAWAPAGTKLFYNVDNRIFRAEGNAMGDAGFERAISQCREAGFRIAIDDFGSGFAGLKLLHMSEPDIIKIDRHFVAGSGGEPRKAAFFEKIVGMAHLMGVPVLAEGIETEVELGVCVEGGFEASFPVLAGSKAEARRGRSRASTVSPSSIRLVEPVRSANGFLQVLERFRKEAGLDILPVVDASDEPIGVYLERDFRQYVYSPYGIAILEHLESGTGAASFLRKAPIAASSCDLARVLEVFGSMPASGGVILTRDSRYAGLLPAAELLSLVAERELTEARDQNPLTRLPGNHRVAEVISQRMGETSRGRAFIYFDFDDFKPFNDRYGFRLGDRVIQLFADILRSVFGQTANFVGHLGGDDFFASCYAGSAADSLAVAAEASGRFRHEAASFYSPEDRDRGWILGRDRFGVEREMPLIGVSAAVVFLAPGLCLDAEELSDTFAALKKEAKISPSHTAYLALEERMGGEPESAHTESGRGSYPAFAVFAPKLRSF